MDELFLGREAYGFEIVSKDYLTDWAANGWLLRHKKTGFEVFYIDAEDAESAFSYSFATVPHNDSGVFHILEHTLLSGSRRYPVRDPFLDLNRSSCNTFMNAMTFPERTMYPAASAHRKDFDNIFSIYTDAVFAPLLKKEAFMQEGIRIVKDETGKLKFDGVVYHEMEGAINDFESVAFRKTVEGLFEGGEYSFESGGNPKAICRLTYEEYLETYKKHYVPANGKLLLYGRDCGLMEKLALLDNEYLKEKGGRPIEPVKAVPFWMESRRREISAPAVEGKQNGTVLLSWLTGLNTDNRERIVANAVSDLLLGTPTSPLYAAILASPLGEDIADASGVYSDFYQMPFIVGFSGIAKANSEKAEAFFLDTLRAIVDKGFSKEEIEAVLSKAEFALREVQTRAGVRIAIKVIRGWERGLPPSSFLSSASVIEAIRSELEKDSRFFEHWIEKNLLENSHRLLLSAIPDKDYLKNEEKRIAEVMETEKVRYSEADEKAFIAFEESEDPAEERAKLPTLSVSDFPRDVISYDTGEKNGILTLSLPCTGHIIYDNLMFDISDFTLEELCDAYLLTKVFASSGTARMAKAKLQSALQLAFGSISSYIEITSSMDGPKQFFVIKAKALAEKHKASLELLSTFLREMKITASDVKDGLVDIISTLREETVYSGSYYMGIASTAPVNRVGYVSDALFGVGSWLWFEEAKKKPVDYFLERLEAIRSRIFSALRLSFQCAGEETDLESATADAAALENTLSADKPGAVPDLSLPAYSARAYIAPSSVAFNALSFASSERFTREQAAEVLLLSCLQGKALWNTIRSRGGAYGADAHVDIIEETATFSSYRDPRVKGSWEDFLSVLKEAPVTQEDLDNAVITAVGASIKPLSPSAKATASVRNRLTGVSDELRRKKREWDLEMSLPDLEEARGRLLKYSEKASFATLVPSAVYDKEQLDMEKVQLPF